METDEHLFTCIGGRYECQHPDCDYDTLNVWAAEAHMEEHGVELEGTDKPDWL
mgnify:CR=1 FL=1